MADIIPQLTNVAVKTWATLGAMAPYLLFGFLVAGVLSVLVSPQTVERHLGSRGLGSVIKAALFGVPLPLCSCGVIPVAASLRNHGASRGATTSFLISTPQTGVDSVLVTFSMLGPVFTVFRPLVALVSGVLGGVAIDIVEGHGEEKPAHPVSCTGECCSPAASAGRGRLHRALRYGFLTLPGDIAKALLAGILIAGVLSALVPEDFFAEYLGGGGVAKQVGSMFVMMLVGLPLYVCATASVPIAAAMIHMGVSPGAALVFLMTGPATNAATVLTIRRVMGKRTAVMYLATVAVSALAAGLLLNWIDPATAAGHHMGHSMLPAWVGIVSAIALLVVLGVALLRPLFQRAKELDVNKGDNVTTLTITGMTCSHCVANVERALKSCAGVKDATVDLKSGKASVVGDAEEAQLRSKVEEAGYKVTAVEKGSEGEEEG
jgi:uncharacterized membrane protein YraQ (UPF0718 family)/copper chaperone CopZ